MKKLYSILVVMLIANFAIAQIGQQVPVKHDNMTGIKKVSTIHNSSAKAGAGDFWFSYVDGLQIYFGDVELEYGGTPMLQDSVATIQYTDGDGRPQFYSFAQVFDFEGEDWINFYANYYDDETGTMIEVPALGGTTTYTIDSMGCTFGYVRADSVDPSVVDTLIMTIAANQDAFSYGSVSSGGSPAWAYAEIGYDIQNACITNEYPLYYQYKLPLTEEFDTSDPENEGYYYFSTFVVPVEGFENISTKNIAVSYSYKSGIPNRNINMVYGTDINRFSGYYIEDAREGYDVNGSDVLMNETNTSMCAMEWSVSDPTFFLFEQYVNNALWNGPLMRPDIYIHAICDDCAWVGIEEMAKKDITVRPNPTSNQFTVELAENTEANVQLFNLLGQEVYSAKVNQPAISINVTDFNPGIYMLRVSQNGNVYTSKVIVK